MEERGILKLTCPRCGAKGTDIWLMGYPGVFVCSKCGLVLGSKEELKPKP